MFVIAFVSLHTLIVSACKLSVKSDKKTKHREIVIDKLMTRL